MATEAYISDHISPLKVEVEDNRYCESSKVAPGELMEVEDHKVESSFIQPLEIEKTVEEKVTDLGDVCLVNQDFVKAIEGENFLQSPQVADEKVEKMDQDQLISNKNLTGSDVVDKIDMNTDEKIIVDSNFDQNTRPVIESTVKEDEDQNKTSNQAIKDIEGKASNEMTQTAISFDEDGNDQIIKDEEFEDSKATNKGEKIEQGSEDETLIDHTKEGNSEVLASCTHENESVTEICKVEEVEELSTTKDPENEIKNGTERSEDISSLATQEPPEEIYEDKLEDTKHSVENIEPLTVTEALDGTSILIPQHDTEKEDLDKDSKVQNVQDISETTTSPIMEEKCEKQIEKVIREVPKELSETLTQGADASKKSEITPHTVQGEETGEENGQCENKTTIVEVESSYAKSESKDQKFEEIHETATSVSAEEKENVSGNNETETLESAPTTDSRDVEEIKEIHVPITGLMPTEEEKQLLRPVSETGNKVDTIEAEVAEIFEKEHVKPEADDVREEQISELASEKVPQESPEAMNEAEKESEIVPDHEIAEKNEECKSKNQSFEGVQETTTKPTSVTIEEHKMGEENKEAKASETIEEPGIIALKEISDFEPTPTEGEIQADEEREEVKAAIDDGANEKHLSTGVFDGHQESSSSLLSEKQDETEEFLVSQTKREPDALGVEEVHETETTAVVEKNHLNKEAEKTKEALEITPESNGQDGKIDDQEFLSDQSFSFESVEGSKDGVEETDKTPTTASKVTNSEENKLDDEAVEQDLELENVKPIEASVKESKLTEDVNKIEADEIVTEAKTEGDNVEAENQKVLGAESDSLEVEEIQEANDKIPMKSTEEDSSKLQETSGEFSQLQNIETGEESAANKIKAEEVKGSDAVSESNDCLEGVYETETTPPAKISKENIEEKMESQEGNNIAVTVLGESKLINEPIDAFGTSSETTIADTIETDDAPKHVPKADDIKLEEASSMETQVLADENETEVESSKLPATESESSVHNVDEIHETDKSPVVRDTETGEIEKQVREVPEVKNQEDIEISQLKNTETVEDSDIDVVKAKEAKGFDEVCEHREPLEETRQTKAEREISGVDEREEEIASAVEQASSTKSQLTDNENEIEACESTTAEKNDAEIVEAENLEVPGAESEYLVHNVAAVIEDEANAQPLSIDEFQERQESSSALLSEKQDETKESLVSQTKTESNVLGVEDVNENETTAAVEKSHANKEEETTKEALETAPESKCKDGKINDEEILSIQSFLVESIQGANGVEEIKLSDEAVENFDMCSGSKTSETIGGVDTPEQDSEVENIKPAETSMEKPKLAEDVNKIEADESVTAAKTMADDVEVENQKVLGLESESSEVEEIQEANASPAETGTIGSEKVEPEVPKSLLESMSPGLESDSTNEITPSRTSETEKIKEEANDLSSDFLSNEESQENGTATTKSTEDDSSKIQETSVTLSQLQNIETGASFANEVKPEEVKGSDAVYVFKDYLEEIHENETTPPAETFEGNIEEKTEYHEGTDSAVTSGNEMSVLGESNLINEPIDTFGSSSETTTTETIETVDPPKHVSKSDINLEEVSSIESQLPAQENEAEVESSELTAAETESLVHNVEEVHETDTSPAVGNTETSEIEKEVIEVPETINQADTVISQLQNLETKEKSDVDVVKVEEEKGYDEVCEPREHPEKIGETKASPNEEISGVVERDEEIESVVEQASSIESQLPANKSEAESCESTTAEKNNVEVDNSEVPEAEVHDVAADIDDEANKQPFSTGEFEEQQESSTTLFSQKQDETGGVLLSQIKTESTVFGVEEVHGTETTAAVEKTHANKEEEEEEEKTKEALETKPESKGQDRLNDHEIFPDQSFPLESVEGTKDGVEETDITPSTASEVTNREEIKINDKAMENFDMCSDSKASEMIETIDTSEQDSEVEKINPAEASTEESKLAEDVNKIEADECETAAKSEADDGEVQNQKVPGAESESLEVEEIQEANASPAGTGSIGSEKVVQEVPKPLPGGIIQSLESGGSDEITPSPTSQTENIEEEARDLSSNFLSSEESRENETTTIEPTEDGSLKLQEASDMISKLQNIETREASSVGEVKAGDMEGYDAVCESKDCLEEIHETDINPTADTFEENVEEKVECREGTDNAVTAGIEVTVLGESKLINGPIYHFGASSETITPETIETVDTPKHVSKVEDIMLGEASSMESQLPAHEAEVESSELAVTESEPSLHNIEEIRETDTSPVVRDTETSEIEKVVGEVPEVVNQADTVVSPIQNIETAEESVVGVVKAEETTGFDEVCEPREHIEEIHETKTSPNVEIRGVDGGEETESVVKKLSAPTTPDVEAVSYNINERPKEETENVVEKHHESSSLLLSELDKTKESEVFETKIESNASETTANSEKTHADNVEEESKEALETMSELKCQDVEAVIDREIFLNKSFPLKSTEDAKDRVEETDIAPKTTSGVTSIGEVKLSDEVVKETHASVESKTPNTEKTDDISQQDSEPEESSILEPKPADHENKIEAQENVPPAKDSDDAEVENHNVLGAEVEYSSFEEIRDENPNPAVGETDTTASEEEVHERRINQDQEVANIKEEVQNTSSVFLPSDESRENETDTLKNTEDDSSKLQETSVMQLQLQTLETQETSDADDVKAEEEKGFDAVCESKDQFEEIIETKTCPTTETSAEVKMEEETNNVAEKKSDIEAVIGDLPTVESTGKSTYPTEKADTDANIKLSDSDDPEEATVLESITSTTVLDVEEIYGNETSPTARQTRTDGEEGETKTVLETASKTNYADVSETDSATAAITEEGSYQKVNPSDEDAKASNISPDTETQEAIQIADTSELDAELYKSQIREHQNVQEIHEMDMSPIVEESDADGINVFDVEDSKSYISVAEPKDQAVQDIHEMGTSPTNREAEMSEIDPETREAPQTINKEINQDSLVVRKDEIAPYQHAEAEKIQEQEKGFDPVPESKDQNIVESLECKTIPTKEVEGYSTKSELEIQASEVDPIPKVTYIVDEQLYEDVGNLRECESDTHIENTIEVAQVTHEITSEELLTEEPQKVETDNSLRETTIWDNSSAKAPEQVSAVKETANVSYEEEERDEKYVDKEPIVENDRKEHENLATETRSTNEVKSPEVILANHENKMGDYNKDEAAIAKLNNNENNDEKTNTEDESHVPTCEKNCIKESVDLTEQEATANASDFSYSKTSEEVLADKREITVDEKQCNLNLDPAPIIPTVEKLVMLPTANNQETVRDKIETNENLKKPQEQEKLTLSQPQEQVASNEYQNEENENKNAIASREFQVISADPAAKQVEMCEEGTPREKSSKSNEKLTQNDPAEVSSSEVLHIPKEEIKQATEKPNTEVEEKALVGEEKTDEEEEDEHKRADSGSDAPVMVEASREIDVKTPHKKSHNILSGVGSKVKHSLAKVKKAITGKSSHKKVSSPKEDKETEYVRLL